MLITRSESSALGSCLGPFIKRLEKNREKSGSRIVLALDSVGGKERYSFEDAARLISEVSPWICSVKLGLPAYFSLGRDVSKLTSVFEGIPFLADFKTADIPHTNQLILGYLFGELGFGGAIVHAFIGPTALSSAREVAELHGAEVLSLVGMSHLGADLLNSNMDNMIKLSAGAGISSLVVPSTLPEMISRARRSAPSSQIFSPGVGVQGGSPRTTLDAGADYLIVGRSITGSDHPATSAMEMCRQCN